MICSKIPLYVFVFSLLNMYDCSPTEKQEESKLTWEQYGKLKNILINPDELIEVGKQFEEQGEYQNALRFYKKAIKRKPSRGAYNKQRGKCYLRMGELGLAMSDFKLVADKESSEKTQVFDYFELIQLGKLYFQKGRTSDACWFYTKAIERKLEPVGYSLRGGCRCRLGLLDEALSDFKEALSMANDSGKEGLQDPILTKSTLAEAVEDLFHEDFESELIRLADKLVDYNKFDEALWCYKEAIKRTPSPTYYAKRGDCYSKMNDIDTAIAEYKIALQLSPNSEMIWYNFLKMMIHCGKSSQAFDEMHNSPVDSAVLTKVANKLYDAHGVYDKYTYVDWTCGEAIGRNVGNAECYELRGLSHAQLGNYTMALGYLHKAGELEPALKERNTQSIGELQRLLQAH